MELLRAIIGRKITRVRRYLLASDYDALAPEVRDQDTDGSVELQFDNRLILHFLPNANWSSLMVGEGELPEWGGGYFLKDVSASEFWNERINREVTDLRILVGLAANESYPCEFGLRIGIQGAAIPALIQYDEDLDALVIREAAQVQRREIVL